MVLTLNGILRAAELPVATTLLLRHSDGRAKHAIYTAAIAKDPRFDDYQRRQVNPQVVAAFAAATHLASFVVDPAGETVFAGIWHLLGEDAVVIPDPFVKEAAGESAALCFRTRRLELLDDLRGRLVIDWGRGFLRWHQRAVQQTKGVLEIRRQITEPPFPGYLQFRHGLAALDALPPSWIQALRVVGGVYLLVHRKGKQFYVGSATGTDGFFGRWSNYRNGHGGNAGLRDLGGEAEDYDVCILETAGSGLAEAEVLHLEANWKQKLDSRTTGLNRN